jgi:hypothetical protein
MHVYNDVELKKPRTNIEMDDSCHPGTDMPSAFNRCRCPTTSRRQRMLTRGKHEAWQRAPLVRLFPNAAITVLKPIQALCAAAICFEKSYDRGKSCRPGELCERRRRNP